MVTATATPLPAVATRPLRALTSTQVQAFQRDGFLLLPAVFTPAEVAAMRARLEDPAVWTPAERAQESHQHLIGLLARHDDYIALARDPRIVERVVDLIGPDVQLQHAKLAAQPIRAGAGGAPWHQDFAYFPHSNTDLVAVMVLVDDHGPDNGCMAMLPGSHRQGLREHRREGRFTGACQPPPGPAECAAAVPVALPAGSVCLHHCLTVHGAGPNRSGQPRRGLVLQYRAADAYQFADVMSPENGLQVAGSYRGVVRCDAGVTWLPACAPWYPAAHPHGETWNQWGPLARRLNPPVLAADAGAAAT